MHGMWRCWNWEETSERAGIRGRESQARDMLVFGSERRRIRRDFTTGIGFCRCRWLKKAMGLMTLFNFPACVSVCFFFERLLMMHTALCLVEVAKGDG